LLPTTLLPFQTHTDLAPVFIITKNHNNTLPPLGDHGDSAWSVTRGRSPPTTARQRVAGLALASPPPGQCRLRQRHQQLCWTAPGHPNPSASYSSGLRSAWSSQYPKLTLSLTMSIFKLIFSVTMPIAYGREGSRWDMRPRQRQISAARVAAVRDGPAKGPRKTFKGLGKGSLNNFGKATPVAPLPTISANVISTNMSLSKAAQVLGEAPRNPTIVDSAMPDCLCPAWLNL